MSRYIDAEKIPFITGDTPNEPLDYVRRYAIDNMPVADVVEVRRGRWKQVGDNTYRCSVCGELSCCCSPYCGECGAQMDLEESE